MRVVFLCALDPTDYRSWSGTPKNMLDALSKKAEVEIIAPLKSFTKPFLYLAGKVLSLIFGKRYNHVHSKILSYEYGY